MTAFEFRDLILDEERARQEQAAQFRRERPLIPVVLCNREGEFFDAAGESTDARVAEDSILVYARDFAEGTPAKYKNLFGVPAQGGMPCWAGYAAQSNKREILGINGDDVLIDRAQLKNKHAREHEPGGYDPLSVYLRMLVPLRVTPLGGLVVQVAPLVYDHDGTLVTYPGTNSLDLTASLPASGLARFVLIYLDPADNTVKTVSGATVTDSLAFIPPLPTPPANTYPSCWVRLAGGQTAISEITDVVDGRILLGRFGATGGGDIIEQRVFS